MKDQRPNVLVVAQHEALRGALKDGLHELDVQFVRTPAGVAEALEPLPDVVLVEVEREDPEGIGIARKLRHTHPQLPVLLMSSDGDLDLAVAALRAGAYDFLTDPSDLSTLEATLDRAIEAHRLRREVRSLRRALRQSRGRGELLGESPAMRRLYEMIDRVARAPSSVLIRGESGTGKELVARALHEASNRASGPFVAVNCAAIPDNLLESELFGHVKGAFTDASSARTGLLVQANNGTIFLDEVGDLPAAMQAKLLRVVQDRRVRPVGSDRETGIDVRVLAATHRDLEAAVERGEFREDLLYRLDVISLDLPPLRERGKDVLLLAQKFLAHHAHVMGSDVEGISPEAARQLMTYSWPGNVRELQNCIERAVVLTRYRELQVEDLPPKVARARDDQTVLAVAQDPVAMLPLAVIERRYIEQVLEAVGGRRAEAAKVLQVDRKTLYRKLERWKLA